MVRNLDGGIGGHVDVLDLDVRERRLQVWAPVYESLCAIQQAIVKSREQV
jgi:hypothetical protein